MNSIIEMITLDTAAEESPWSKPHLYRILTDSAYSHLDPRPEIRRLVTGRTNVLLRHEWEDFKARLASTPKPARKTPLMEARRQARLAREAEAPA